jgi:V-type H+-transporting ATPase subunit H
MQLLYETCLCIWLLSYFEPAIDYLSTTRVMPRLVDVVKGSTKEKVRHIFKLSTGKFWLVKRSITDLV